MRNERDRAHDIAEEGLDKIIEGDREGGRRMIDQAKKKGPKGVDQLAEEVDRDQEQAERFKREK